MTKNPIYKILSRLFKLRPEEKSSSLLMFYYFFLITFSAYIIKSANISRYLNNNITKLPIAYLLAALLMGIVVPLNSKLLQTLRRQVYISLSLFFFIFSSLLFWWLFRLSQPWVPLAFWLWADVFLITSVTQFWILVNDLYNPRQARRLVGFFVSGGLLGGLIGSLLTFFLAKSAGTENLILICPFLLGLVLLILKSVQKSYPKEERPEVRTESHKPYIKKPRGGSLSLLRKNRYLLLLSGIMAAAIVVSKFIDFQFNWIAKKTFPETNSRTAFLGLFFAGLLIFSYLVNALLTNLILKKFGIRTALLIVPAVLMTFAGAIFFVPAAYILHWAIAARGADKSLSHSLNQSVRELLYIPIPAAIKYRAKVFIDMFVNKFADASAALLLILLYNVMRWDIPKLSFIAMAFALIWVGLNILITKEYVGIVKKNLSIKWQDADRFVSDKIDIDMTKLVFDTLQSRERSSVLYAMNLLDLIKQEKLSPEMKKIIGFKSDEIRARSMDSLLDLDGEALLPEMDDTLDAESLDQNVREIMSMDVYQELMKEHIDEVMKEEDKTSEVAKMETAKALGMMSPDSPLAKNLSKLLRDESPEVFRYAAESAGRLKRREFVSPLILRLGKPTDQAVAGKALVACGEKIVGTLKDYLSDHDEDLRLRRAIPDILADIGTQRAADVLVLELIKKNKDAEPEIIEAMHKMRSRHPQISFQEKEILAEVKHIIKKSFLILMEIQSLKTDEKKTLLVKDLENNLAHSLKHIFELLGLIYSQEDIIRAYQNICAGTKKTMDYAVELLDNILKKDTKEALLPLIEDMPLDEKVKMGKKLMKTLGEAEES